MERRLRIPAVILLGLLAASMPQVAVARESPVTVAGHRLEDGSVVVRATSTHIIPVYLSVDLPRLVDMEADAAMPFRAELPAGATDVELFRLRPTRQSGQVGYTLSYGYARGNPHTVSHDDDHRYLVPFAHGDKRRLSQAFHGSFSHFGENAYAVDFEMPEGTPVHAARDGFVAEVKRDSRIGGTSTVYNTDANYILIMHDDGSFANYAHLRVGGAVVEPGDRVTAGDLIGFSGNTGRSSGPHLHFDVRIPMPDGAMQSIPFVFLGADGAAVHPVQGRYYYAHHPGGEPFVELHGDAVQTADFADYAEPYRAEPKLNVRVEQIDLTFLVFAQNGLDREVAVDVAFQLRGMRSDEGIRVRRAVPAYTEVLLTILRPLPNAASIQYGYTVRYR